MTATPPPVNPTYSTQPVAPGDFPGKTLGIVGLVLGILIPLVGAIISHVALSQSKKAGFSNTPALIGIIVGWILTALGAIFWILWIAIFAAAFAQGAYTG